MVILFKDLSKQEGTNFCWNLFLFIFLIWISCLLNKKFKKTSIQQTFGPPYFVKALEKSMFTSFLNFEYLFKTPKFFNSSSNIENIATKCKWFQICKNGIKLLLTPLCTYVLQSEMLRILFCFFLLHSWGCLVMCKQCWVHLFRSRLGSPTYTVQE